MFLAVLVTLISAVLGIQSVSAQDRPMVEAEPVYSKYSIPPETVLSNAFSRGGEILEHICSVDEISPEIMAQLRLRDDFEEILAWTLQNCPDVVGSVTAPATVIAASDGGGRGGGGDIETCVGEDCDGGDETCVGEDCDDDTPKCLGNPGNNKCVGRATEDPTGTGKHWDQDGKDGYVSPKGSTGASKTSREGDKGPHKGSDTYTGKTAKGGNATSTDTTTVTTTTTSGKRNGLTRVLGWLKAQGGKSSGGAATSSSTASGSGSSSDSGTSSGSGATDTSGGSSGGGASSTSSSGASGPGKSASAPGRNK